jgi:uncharacterized protein YjiS (DUF1127 family)
MATLSFGRISVVLAPAAPAGPGLLQRLRAWMRHRRTLAELAEADARTCRDLGIAPRARDGLVQAFGVDPLPIWGIGGVVQPGTQPKRHD